MNELWIRTNDFQTSQELHRYIQEFLELPNYYGKNLSALYDCLTDLADTTRISYQDTGFQSQDMALYFQKVQRVLRDAAGDNPSIILEI